MRPIGGLTPRQKELLDFIKRYTADNGLSPSYEEMMAGTGIVSKGVVHGFLSRMRQSGLVSFTDRPRSVVILHSTCPSCGRHLIEASNEKEKVSIRAASSD